MVLRENGLVADALKRKNEGRRQQYSTKITENVLILLQFGTVEVYCQDWFGSYLVLLGVFCA
ncbi:hypothetical protein ASF91_12705 [Rhizobium sp. Leaf155]|nr:hypothetical protein ASF91_12705 [Rhizobium sp. Leaf155]